MAPGGHPGALLIVRFRSALAPDELKRRYKQRMPEFGKLPGLLQKYYIHDKASGEWGGVYLWDSQASLDNYLGSDLCKSIAKTYEIVGMPRVEAAGVVDVLRPELP
jgi:Putative mono-oxygenase ydhR